MYMVGIYRFEDNKPVFTLPTAPLQIIFPLSMNVFVMLPKEIHSDWLNINNNAEGVIDAAMLDIEYKTA